MVSNEGLSATGNSPILATNSSRLIWLTLVVKLPEWFKAAWSSKYIKFLVLIGFAWRWPVQRPDCKPGLVRLTFLQHHSLEAITLAASINVISFRVVSACNGVLVLSCFYAAQVCLAELSKSIVGPTMRFSKRYTASGGTGHLPWSCLYLILPKCCLFPDALKAGTVFTDGPPE